MIAHPLVCVWYDTEDYVAPASDDAALRLARLHTDLGLPATFKLVGEKARRLEQRQRQDVLAALARHEVGYHTNFHSAHPTVTEYCESLPWEEGVAFFRHLESAGFRDVARLLGQPGRPAAVVTYGQPGGAWAPQAYPVLREWGLRSYVDEGPWIGLDEQPFWFMGLLHIMRMGPNLVRFSLRQPNGAEQGIAAFEQARRQLAGGALISIYFHPCEWVTEAFWDGVNYRHGRNPPLDQLVMPPLTPGAEVERRFAAMERFLRHIAESEATAVGCSALPALYPDRAASRALNRAELLELTAAWRDEVSYLATPDGWLTAAEVLSIAAGLLSTTSEQELTPVSADGPHDDVTPLRERLTVPVAELVAAAQYLTAFLRTTGHSGTPTLPAGIPVGTRVVRPEEFLPGLLQLLRAREVGREPAGIELRPTQLEPAGRIRHCPDAFSWAIFPEGFDAPNVMAHARRQAWTLKPATPAPNGA